MSDDNDMVNMMDELSVNGIGGQHFQWTIDDDPLDDLAYSFILVFEHHRKATADNHTSTMDNDDDNDDTLFLSKWEKQDLDQRVDLDSIIHDNPLGLVAIDPNQPSSVLRPQLISVDQQLPPPLAQAKQKPLKRPPSLLSLRPTTSKPQQTKNKGKKPKNRRLQPKNPNL